MSDRLVTNLKNKSFPGLSFFSITLVYALLLAVSPGSYASELINMLEKMSSASQSLNYQGTFILRKSDQTSTLRVKHGKDKRGVWESLETLNGEPRKVIRQNKKVISIFPDKKLLTVRQSQSSTSLKHKFPENLAQLTRYYTFHQLTADRVAGYKTLVLDLKPKDRYRYGYRYWLEKDTGMLLRCDLLNTKRSVIEQMMFTQMKYLDKPPDKAFKVIELKGYTIKNLDDAARPDKPVVWQVTQPPAGFKFIQSHYRKSPSSADLLQLVYSDGLASVSVFIEKLKNKSAHLVGGASMGAIHAYGLQHGGHYVTAVGEVPALTVMQMAKTTKQIDRQVH